MSPPSKRTNGFRFNARFTLCTYAQSAALDCEHLVLHLRSLSKCFVIGRENHADGGIHYHAFIDFGRKFSTRDCHFLDVDGFHPNIGRGYGSPSAMCDYATKDGDIVSEEGNARERHGSGTGVGPRGTTNATHAKWTDIISQGTRESFFDSLAQNDPKSLICCFGNISKYADWKYAIPANPYSTPPGITVDSLFPEGEEWLQRNVRERTAGIR